MNPKNKPQPRSMPDGAWPLTPEETASLVEAFRSWNPPYAEWLRALEKVCAE